MKISANRPAIVSQGLVLATAMLLTVTTAAFGQPERWIAIMPVGQSLAQPGAGAANVVSPAGNVASPTRLVLEVKPGDLQQALEAAFRSKAALNVRVKESQAESYLKFELKRCMITSYQTNASGLARVVLEAAAGAADRDDHVGAYNFMLEVAGGGPTLGGFRDVSQTQTTSGRVKYSNIVLKRGYVSSDRLWDWQSRPGSFVITGRGSSGPACRIAAFDAVVASVRGEGTNGEAEVTLRARRVEGRC